MINQDIALNSKHVIHYSEKMVASLYICGFHTKRLELLPCTSINFFPFMSVSHFFF